MRAKIRLSSFAIALALLATTFSLSPQPAYACSSNQTPPAGRRYFVTAVGRFVPGEWAKRAWIRVAEYNFNNRGCGTIDESLWYWQLDTFVGRTSAGRATGCSIAYPATHPKHGQACDIWTATGFEAGSATGYPKTVLGTFNVSGSNLTITWTSTGWTETWAATNLLLTPISRIKLTAATYGTTLKPTHGWGWGSTQPFTFGKTVRQIRTAGGSYGMYSGETTNRYLVKYETDGKTSNPIISTPVADIPVGGFSECNNSPGCLMRFGDFTLSGSSCLGCTEGTDRKNTREFLANIGGSHPRQSTYNQECVCHAQGAGTAPCIYAGHVKPFLQIVDDLGNFHGWVGGEASLSGPSPNKALISILEHTDL